MSEPKVLLGGLGIPESPRWHEGRLWFCNWIDRQIVAVGLDGTPEVFPARDQGQQMGYSIDWLPDGRLLMTGDKLRRQEPDGSMVTVAEQKANEIVVDGRGNIYLNGADFKFSGGEAPRPGYIKLVTPDGQLRQVAGDIQFPNGMVITPDNQTLIISESFTGQLTALRHRPGRRPVRPAGVRRGRRPRWHLPRRRRCGLGFHGVLVRPRRRGRQGSATRRTARGPGSVRADARRAGPADPVHPDRRMAPGRPLHQESPAADPRSPHRRDPYPPCLGARHWQTITREHSEANTGQISLGRIKDPPRPIC
jgi:hypothetical protein